MTRRKSSLSGCSFDAKISIEWSKAKSLFEDADCCKLWTPCGIHVGCSCAFSDKIAEKTSRSVHKTGVILIGTPREFGLPLPVGTRRTKYSCDGESGGTSLRARLAFTQGMTRFSRPKQNKQHESANIKRQALLKVAAREAQHQAKQSQRFAQCVGRDVAA